MTFYKGKRGPEGLEVWVTKRDDSKGNSLPSPSGVAFDWGAQGKAEGRRALAEAILQHALGAESGKAADVELFERAFVDTLAHVRWELARVRVQRFAKQTKVER
jgi:hypothetical protein